MMLKDKIKEEKFKEWMLKWSNKKFKNTMFLTPIQFYVAVDPIPYHQPPTLKKQIIGQLFLGCILDYLPHYL